MKKLLLIAAVAISGASATSDVKVPDRVPLKVQPFPIQSVRLLDGPFRQAMQLDQEYLLALDPDRLLHNFRVNAGITSDAKPLGGWEAPDVELRGHTAGHYMSALALMYASTGDTRFKSRADLMVAELAHIQAAQARKFHAGYLSAFPEEFFDRVDARQRVWAPYYTIHKIMAGLLDVHQLCDNAQALAVVTKMADWVKFRVDRLSDEQQQRTLQTEFGGMNEVLANIYAATGNAAYLQVAHRFDHKAIFDPLSRHEDPLNGLHANTQFPKIIGAAREYELTGDARFQDIASYFWDRVVNHRTFVMGGNSDGEAFFPEEEFSKHLGASGPETCNTYNMLKLTRHIFEWSADAAAMDFYERALFNHILPSQDPQTGMVIYYCPLRPGGWKSYATQDDSFWCCVGTGMENHAKYGDTIFFHDSSSLYVNLFIPSELTWKDKGLVVRQTTKFPEEEETHLTLKLDRSVRFGLKVRQASWAAGATVSVNGRDMPHERADGAFYVTIDREWKDGDRVDVKLPMRLHTETLPDNPKMVAVMYGPMVLVGDLGTEGLESVKRYGPSAPQMGRVKTPVIPAFVGSAADVTAKIERDGRMQFKTKGLAQPNEVTLVPLYRIVDQRYNVYWNLLTPAEWNARRTDTAAADARRKGFAERTIDRVDVDAADSEKNHQLASEKSTDAFFEGKRIREARGGWFSYQLKVAPDRPVTIVAAFRGSEGRRRAFDVLVDGEKIASESLEYHPTEQLDREYTVPETLTRGKSAVTVKFEAQAENSTAGALIDVRTVNR
ncbi:MAG TPA: beta-L-arabinofuranosidase domain-containing protein [Vicinamibacterales bacterium]|nr:beta-L-arabinofuranosidase domain-containing protein [Vicinamibacterales bacterium]